jgi:hypothetical protein
MSRIAVPVAYNVYYVIYQRGGLYPMLDSRTDSCTSFLVSHAR